jgi:hypothetical protein
MTSQGTATRTCSTCSAEITFCAVNDAFVDADDRLFCDVKGEAIRHTPVVFPYEIGDLVRKGNGSTVYRITHLSAARGGTAGVCKATTAKDPARTCMYPFDAFTKVEAQA